MARPLDKRTKGNALGQAGFHADLNFWRWLLGRTLARDGESVVHHSFHTTDLRLHTIDASLGTVGGYCPKLNTF